MSKRDKSSEIITQRDILMGVRKALPPATRVLKDKRRKRKGRNAANREAIKEE